MSQDRTTCRDLVLLLGDQLDVEAPLLAETDPAADVICLVEAQQESEKVWSHKARIALFMAAMRHFRDALRKQGRTVHYRALDDAGNRGRLGVELQAAIAAFRPRRVICTQPGAWSVLDEIRQACRAVGAPLEVRPDAHFLCGLEAFEAHCAERKQLRMEYFYRQMRRRHDVLMDGDAPAGGRWNYDPANRKAFGPDGPGNIPDPPSSQPDAVTRGVFDLVERRFAGHPGSLRGFDYPVTRRSALAALRGFVRERLVNFGRYQDAMWVGRTLLWHSRLSAALNLKLLSPREVIAEVEDAWRDGAVPIEAAEGFIRQVLGWREYVRGVYWRFMPDYKQRNALGADRPLPGWYWTGQTDAACLAEVIGQTLATGYAHHIQRLMVTGLFALLLGVDPVEVHQWYLAVYVDAVEWVELPNTLGMSQYADGGVMASKPYAATGKYINRMSNYCRRCRYDPSARVGPNACPFTTLYWDFLLRHRDRFADHPRMALPVRNADRLDGAERRAIRNRAGALKDTFCRQGTCDDPG